MSPRSPGDQHHGGQEKRGTERRRGSLSLALLSETGAGQTKFCPLPKDPTPQHGATGQKPGGLLPPEELCPRGQDAPLPQQRLFCGGSTRKPSWPLGHRGRKWVPEPVPHLALASCAGPARFWTFTGAALTYRDRCLSCLFGLHWIEGLIFLFPLFHPQASHTD